MSKLLRIIETLLLIISFGLLPLVFCLLATLIITAVLFEIQVIEAWVLWSLMPGIIIDIIFMRRWVRNAYQMSKKVLVPIYLFYSVVALGMGMGVPIFNFALCIAAGLYIARKMHLAGVDEEIRKRNFKRMAVFCASVMVLICCLITLWAIAGQMIGYKFETPCLSFTFSVPIFFAIVLAGGAMLVLLQYWLTNITARLTFKLLSVTCDS
jgi:hypothetical protein